MSDPVKVFISYSHKDDELRAELDAHLSSLCRRQLIEPWHDRRITGGEEWKGLIDDNLEQAQIILFLVSANFLASNYCYDLELKRALERHQQKSARVIPIIIRASNWRSSLLGALQAFPTDGKAVMTWGADKFARDTAWQVVSERIEKVTQQIRDELEVQTTATAKAQAEQTYRVLAEDY